MYLDGGMGGGGWLLTSFFSIIYILGLVCYEHTIHIYIYILYTYIYYIYIYTLVFTYFFGTAIFQIIAISNFLLQKYFFVVYYLR